MSSKQVITKVESFNAKKLKVSELQKNQYIKGQSTAYISYTSEHGDKPLVLQTPWIKLSTGGIPPQNEFFDTDKKRAFLNIPLEDVMLEKMGELDQYLTSNKFKKEFFKKNPEKWSFYNIVKVRDEEDDREPYPPSMKLKFDLVYNEKDSDACEIKTQVSLKNDGKREEYNAKSLDDMLRYVRRGCELRLIIRPAKIWAGSGKKEYGVIWKILKMEIIPSKTSDSVMSQFMREGDFLDSDDEEEVLVKGASDEEVPVKPKGKKTVVKEDSDSESDNEEKVPVKSKGKKTVVKEDSESESDNEEKVPVKSKGKKTVVKEDSDSDSDNEVPVVKSSKKKVSKVESESESESESDDEPVVPIKKRVK